MLRRVTGTSLVAAASVQQRSYGYIFFKNTERRPQLTAEQREKVVVNQDEWPAEFKDFDPEDPYKKFPNFIPGMNSWQWWSFGAEIAFVIGMYSLVFPQGMRAPVREELKTLVSQTAH